MTRTDLIDLLESVIEELDELRGSIEEGAALDQLDDLRDKLSDRQLQLVKAQFDENTAAFQEATDELAAVNADLKSTINQINKMVETIENLKRLVAAVDQVLGTALAIV